MAKRKRIKQKTINMIGCSKSHKHNKSCSGCSKCGPNCHCGPNCNCPHNCPGNCYLNRRMKGGAGCGSTECPVGGLQSAARLRGGSSLTGSSILNNTPPGFPYNPSQNPGLQAIEDTGYLNKNNAIGGYIYKGKHSKKQSKSFSRRKTKSHTNKSKSKTFKHYKYKGGGLISEIMHNFQTAANAIAGYPAPTDPTVYKDQLVNNTRLRL